MAWLPMISTGRSGRGEHAGGAVDFGRFDGRRGHGDRHRFHGVEIAREHAIEVTLQVKPEQFAFESRSGAVAFLEPVPLADQRFVIKQIDGALHKHRPGRVALRHAQGVFEHRNDIAVAVDGHRHFDDRFDQCNLLDILKRPPALDNGRRRTAEQHHRRLGHLRIFQGRDGVGHARSGGDRRHARNPAEPRHGIGRKHGGGLIAHIDDRDPLALAAHQNRRDVPAAEGEQMTHPLNFQNTGDDVPAMDLHTRLPRSFSEPFDMVWSKPENIVTVVQFY
jgi:hypothetical protein